MLLTNKNTITITINDIEIEVLLNFRTLENLYNLILDKDLNETFNINDMSPLELVKDLDNGVNELDNLAALLFCMSNGKIEFFELKSALETFDEDSFYVFLKIVKKTIVEQIIYVETTDSHNDVNNLDNENTDILHNKMKDFEDYFNYFYLISTTELKYSLEEFYTSTPKKIKASISVFNMNRRNILIKVYNEIMSANNTSNTNTNIKENIEIATDANTFFSRI